MGDNLLVAERGGVYRFNNGGEDKYCVVVSSGRRSKDNIISILFFTTDRGNIADDVVRFEFNGTTYCVRTDLITYTQRKYLVEKLAIVSEHLMNKIDTGMLRSLGLFSV